MLAERDTYPVGCDEAATVESTAPFADFFRVENASDGRSARRLAG